MLIIRQHKVNPEIKNQCWHTFSIFNGTDELYYDTYLKVIKLKDMSMAYEMYKHMNYNNLIITLKKKD
jgi:hypothetical protein